MHKTLGPSGLLARRQAWRYVVVRYVLGTCGLGDVGAPFFDIRCPKRPSLPGADTSRWNVLRHDWRGPGQIGFASTTKSLRPMRLTRISMIVLSLG